MLSVLPVLCKDYNSLLQPQGMAYAWRAKEELRKSRLSTAQVATRLLDKGILNRKEEISCFIWAKREALWVPHSRNFFLIINFLWKKAVVLHSLFRAPMNGSKSGFPICHFEQTSKSITFRNTLWAQCINPRLCLFLFSFSMWAWGVENCS